MALEPQIWGFKIPKTPHMNRLCLADKMRPSRSKSEVVTYWWIFEKQTKNLKLWRRKFLDWLQNAITQPFYHLERSMTTQNFPQAIGYWEKLLATHILTFLGLMKPIVWELLQNVRFQESSTLELIFSKFC